MSFVPASEAFFDNLTVEQEFMTGVDTDKVLFNYILFPKLICHKNDSPINMCVHTLWFDMILIMFTDFLTVEMPY